MVVCVPTTVAGGGRKCYDFCGRWGLTRHTLFDEIDAVFSDAANKAIGNAKPKIFQPDWLRVLEPDGVADSIRRIT